MLHRVLIIAKLAGGDSSHGGPLRLVPSPTAMGKETFIFKQRLTIA